MSVGNPVDVEVVCPVCGATLQASYVNADGRTCGGPTEVILTCHEETLLKDKNFHIRESFGTMWELAQYAWNNGLKIFKDGKRWYKNSVLYSKNPKEESEE